MNPRIRALAGAGCAVALLVLSGCSAGSDGSTQPTTGREPEATVTATPQAEVTGTPAAGAEVIEITLDGTTVSPLAQKVEITRNQPVVFRVSSSAAGQLHVHSSPEEVVAFGPGESEITLRFDKPGVVDVEDHALDELIVQLEVN